MRHNAHYAFAAAIIAWHSLFTFVLPDVPLARLLSGLALLFIVPGWFIERLLFRATRTDWLERAFIILLTSSAGSILWAFALNQALRIPFTDAGIFFMSATLVLLTGVLDFILRPEPERVEHASEEPIRKRRQK